MLALQRLVSKSLLYVPQECILSSADRNRCTCDAFFRLGSNTQRAAIARAFTKARTERSICFGVVAQSQTLTRMTARPCQVEPPHQHSPELWMFCSVALVRASSSHEASTWLKTTSLWI